MHLKLLNEDPGIRATKGVGLRPMACWDYGIEFRQGHGCLSVRCEYCVLSGRVLCEVRSLA